MKLIAAALISAAALVSAPAMANLDLAKKSNCMSCHTVDKKLVGPAYKDVAAKYAGKADAVKTLTAKVKAGGKGNWGEIPMPPNANVKDADIETLVKWILAGAK
ncbi:c-type cytochrome [Sulfurisoma sediminicola]|uniref:Cytochrome c n=1 Tax=Sulfurisoma sediminicola TaxID=1381557 RepID=A0A497XK91_9PROT|nr:c-type cytochrome [Sulfurisoma sediminicola]RLJ68373.1 cytochrome c [Sulfurisoma sediminicola]